MILLDKENISKYFVNKKQENFGNIKKLRL